MSSNSAIPQTAARRIRWFSLVLACLLLAGCQSWPFERRADEPASPSGGEGEPRNGQQVITDSIGQAMTLLQNGEEKRAEEMLAGILADNPEDATARLLLAQIRQPPEELLGESFEVIEVQSGDSLSAIAGRTIENELLFYSLARLNDIDVPRLLRAGQRIRVPSAPEDEFENVQALEPPASEESPADEGNAELGTTAASLIERERYNQAYALLLSAARAGKLREADRPLLAQSAVALARAACREDDPARARKLLDQALPWLGVEAESSEFVRQREHVEARLALGRAEQSLARGAHADAFDALLIARDLDEGLRETHRQRLERLEVALGDHYHGSALTAWRDQQVDRAVELWDRVLRINPEFEPAIRYLERARRAQRELRSLENG